MGLTYPVFRAEVNRRKFDRIGYVILIDKQSKLKLSDLELNRFITWLAIVGVSPVGVL